MTAQTCAVAQTATLSTTNADAIVFTGVGKYLMVANHDASTALYFRADGTTAVGAADDNYYVQAGSSLTLGPSKFGPLTRLSVVGNGNIYTAQIF